MPNQMDIDSGEGFPYRIAIENINQGDVSRITAISMVDVASGEKIAIARVSPVGRGESVTVTLDLLSADGQSLTFIVDSTSKVFELDEENNSFEVSVLDVMTHDINVESITVTTPIDFIEKISFRWAIANDLSRWGRVDRSRCDRDLLAGGGGDDDWCNEVPSSRG